MKKSLIFLSIIFLFVQCQNAEAQKKRPAPKPKVLSAREIASKVLPSVVLIITQDENGAPISQGSGFVYKPGLVVTNLHVFERASNAIVKNVKTGEISKAIEVVGMNAVDDICVIRIDNTKFPALLLGDSDSIQTGDEIYAASNPKGLEGSFTKGIISRFRDGVLFEEDREGDEFYELAKKFGLNETKVIQFDAAVSPGSSGGVLLNDQAQAIGIIRASAVGGQNLNFAIPINRLKVLSPEFHHPIKLAGSCALNGWAEAGLTGRVKMVWDDGLIFRYDEYGNEIAREFNGKAVLFTFDHNGLLTSRTDKENGKIIKEISYDRGTSIEMKLDRRISAGRKGSIKEGNFTIYNKNGDMAEWIFSDSRIVVDFDDNGRKIRESKYDNGLLYKETRYEYKDDRNGNWVEKNELTRSFADKQSQGKWGRSPTIYREIEYYK